MTERPYYEAYDERYKTVHAQQIRWFGDEPSAVVGETICRYQIHKRMNILEIGCGEGRDAIPLLKNGYTVLATDVSPEAVRYCRDLCPEYETCFQVLDCIHEKITQKFDFIFADAVIHMLVRDEDRSAFFQFVYNHLKADGTALICSMGDGEMQRQSDIATAFELQERTCGEKTVMVAGTSCRMVDFPTLEREITAAGLTMVEKGMTEIPENFPCMMYGVVRRKKNR